MTRHIVQFSGGASSFAAAARVVERYGSDAVTLLTADTKSEIDGWREWIDAAAAKLDTELVVLCDGRDIWELAEDQNMIPASRAGFCSRILKQALLDEWQAEHADPPATVLHFGFDISEAHRLASVRKAKKGWQCEAPLTWDPPMWPGDALDVIDAYGLERPAAYDLGLPHNNCLKYGCVKGGITYWRKLLHVMPEAFARSEAAEERLRARIGDHAILKDRTGSTASVTIKRPLPLRELREREEAGAPPTGDWGECGCLSLFEEAD